MSRGPDHVEVVLPPGPDEVVVPPGPTCVEALVLPGPAWRSSPAVQWTDPLHTQGGAGTLGKRLNSISIKAQ